MLIYLLKANIALVLFYLAYRFGLRRLTFYSLNRFFLISGILCATVGPLIDPSVFIQKHHELNVVAEAYILDLSALQKHPSEPFINILVKYVFWLGVIVMTIRFAIQLFSLWRLHHQTRRTVFGDESLRIMEQNANPFSFMRNIYINPSLHTPEEFSSIIQHEKVHVRQWHTLDVLLGELNKIFYWFNPGAWLMSIAIRENLEFITDRSILRQGIDAKSYQYSLLKVSGIPYATAIANNFNFSHLKQRIMMMNKKRSSRYHLLRYVVLGAVMGIAVLSLNFSRAIAKAETSANKLVNAFQEDTSKVKVPPPAAPLPPPPPPPPAPPVKGKGKGEKVPPPPPPVPPVPAAPAVAPVPAAAAAPAPAGKELRLSVAENADAAATDKPKIVLRGGANGQAKPLYVIDDAVIGSNLPEGMINPEDISSIYVLKDESATTIYGDAGKNGVVKIYTKGYIGAPVVDRKGFVPTTPGTAATAPTKVKLVSVDEKGANVKKNGDEMVTVIGYKDGNTVRTITTSNNVNANTNTDTKIDVKSEDKK
ncbi:TonB-dependent Receptor Plug Domain [Chitinophaga sp. YR627]|uniref:M56 family metallopeptidase n=1 Tax=Chitinophaga sp. YR627 TaxID=1881041 RepID=UPI0008E214BE|nr:M56 family metallopeptidase [Chitinophaga sp. YR627]SFN40480.1 TonB-dependent Receptor Plug Domain [Chitinophaga sp. YR627]